MKFITIFFMLFMFSLMEVKAQDYFSGDFDNNKIEFADESDKTLTKKIDDNVKKNVIKNDNVAKKEVIKPVLKNDQEIKVDKTFENDKNSLLKDDNAEINNKVDFFMNDLKENKVQEKPVIKDEAILIEYTPAIIDKTMGGITTCRYGFKFINNTNNFLKRIRINFFWSGEKEYKQEISMNDIPPLKDKGRYFDIPGEKRCNAFFIMSPKAKIKSCIMEGVLEIDCAKKIRFKK